MPATKSKLDRLYDAIESSHKELKTFQDNRLKIIRAFVGYHYSSNGSPTRTPFDLIEMAKNIFRSRLVTSNPAVDVGTFVTELQAYADNFGLAINHAIRQMNLVETLKELVDDALFGGISFAKAGLARVDSVTLGDTTIDVGAPFVGKCSLDDMFFDMSARRLSQISFIGNRYRVSYEEFMSGDFYENQKGLLPTHANWLESQGRQKVDKMSRKQRTEAEEYREMIELQDVWLPDDGKFITLNVHGPRRKVREVDWDGPETGPYLALSFLPVPDNIMPLSPMGLLYDMHDLGNILFNKMAEQAKRQKTITAAKDRAAQDAVKIINSKDGDVITGTYPEEVRQFVFGGVDANTLAFFLQVRQLASYIGGNLDSLGGLNPQSGTGIQDEMLQQAASQKIADMQNAVQIFTNDLIGKHIAFYLWNDPLIDIPITKRIPNIDVDIKTRFNPEMRRGDFLDYNFKIVPFSMTEPTPSQKLQTMLQTWERFIVPFAQQWEMQGYTPNLPFILKKIAKYTNNTDIEGMLRSDVGLHIQQMVGEPGARPLPKPQNTRREYVRKNVPQATQSGQENVLMQSLLGSRMQNSQAKQIGGTMPN